MNNLQREIGELMMANDQETQHKVTVMKRAKRIERQRWIKRFIGRLGRNNKIRMGLIK